MLPRDSGRFGADDNTKRVRKGRSWTASQLERKRQLDRESQRHLREKTKNRISHLEGLVKSLQDNDDERVQKLYRQIDQQQAEIQRLQSIIRGISKLVEDSGLDSSLLSERPKEVLNQSNAQITPPPEPDEPVPHQTPQFHGQNETPVVLDEPILWPEAPIDLFNDTFPTFDSQTGPISSPSPTIAQLAASIADDMQLEGRLWYLCGGILAHLLNSPMVDLPITTEFDQDIAIRAVFEGWSAVSATYRLDSCWQWLKELDERVYGNLPKVNRLMHMRNVRLVFLQQVFHSTDWNSQIPSFFKPQPAEKCIAHDPLIEHFPWPAFRERLLYAPLKFATNKFMDTLRTQVDFIWNRSDHELYRKEPLTGLYSYSDELDYRLKDIRCYAVKRGFFEKFPELRSDIPCSAPWVRNLFPNWSSPQGSITSGEEDFDDDTIENIST